MYGRAAQIYGLQSRRDKKNDVVGEKRKDYNVGGNKGNFKRSMNGDGNFQGRNNKDNNNKGRAERVYQCNKCSNNHPSRDYKGEPITCNYRQKKAIWSMSDLSSKRRSRMTMGVVTRLDRGSTSQETKVLSP